MKLCNSFNGDNNFEGQFILFKIGTQSFVNVFIQRRIQNPVEYLRWSYFCKKVHPICGALRDLIPFVQFEKREKHPWKNVTFSKVAS